MSTDTLRVIEFGRVSPLRSQTLWHAIAQGVSADSPATLSFMRPDRPYVSTGFHRRLEEIDAAACRRAGLPVYRRMVGGGPVYLDDDQLFFQITVPVQGLPAIRSEAMRLLLAPVVAAFRDAGIDATMEQSGEIVVGDRKICGHAAGQIEQAVIVVGNVIERFDYGAAARILNAPDDDASAELEQLMRRYVQATPVDQPAFVTAAVERYASALALEPEPGSLTGYEQRRLVELDTEFLDDDWLRGPDRSANGCWRVKIKAGVFLVDAVRENRRARLSVADARIVRARLGGPELDGAAAGLQQSLVGLTLGEGRTLVAGLGHDGLAALIDDVERAVQR